MALADMVIVIVEIADVALKEMKDNVITATFKVVYMSSSFWLLAVGSNDLSQAEKEITACTGKSFSEALILASVNPKYDKRLFIEFPEKYRITTCWVQILF